ncbi:3-methyladenine DNA glycosylase [Rothia sp. CCM 9417]|uniref:3-methyladenine DNA glycosylase n=1 Tax=unclassified Rothia (in: high G+C Gram-positive bacteria) TaxID=2689056 RepID=UPI003ADD318D
MPLQILSSREWRAQAAAHEERAGTYALPFTDRRERGHVHPVEDFLFTYYTLKPGQFMRWHPGAGTILLDAPERLRWKYYRPVTASELMRAGMPLMEARRHADSGTAVTVDHQLFAQERRSALDFTRTIISNTAEKPGEFSCFGLHEWAMAYKSVENDIRHDYLNLRLGAQGTDQVVESHKIKCSHFDAFRFFMPQATELNELQPTREAQRNLEQPSCLHANMDIYKWAYKLLPLVDSNFLMDCFELARDIREVDMKASPYDLREWGYEPIAIETPKGKASYVKLQKDFAQRSQVLRHKLLAKIDPYFTELACSAEKVA